MLMFIATTQDASGGNLTWPDVFALSAIVIAVCTMLTLCIWFILRKR